MHMTYYNKPEPVGGSSQTIGGLHQSMSRFITYLPLKNQSNILETDKFSEDRITVFREEASSTCCKKPILTSIFSSRETILIRLTDKTQKSSKPEVSNIIYFLKDILKTQLDGCIYWLCFVTILSQSAYLKIQLSYYPFKYKGQNKKLLCPYLLYIYLYTCRATTQPTFFISSFLSIPSK